MGPPMVQVPASARRPRHRVDLGHLHAGLRAVLPGPRRHRPPDGGRQATPETVALIDTASAWTSRSGSSHGNFVADPPWRPRLRLLPPNPGKPDHHRRLAEDPLAGARRCCAVDGLWPIQRNRFGLPATVADRPFANAVLVIFYSMPEFLLGLLLLTRLLPATLVGAAWFPGRWLRAVQPGPPRLGSVTRPCRG
jgi:hypothetical protein